MRGDGDEAISDSPESAIFSSSQTNANFPQFPRRARTMSFSRGVETRLRSPLPKPASPRFTNETSSPVRSVMNSPEFNAVTGLDAHFAKFVHDITNRLSLLARAPTIRVEKWVRKLHEPVHNDTWRKLRNAYARLLLYNLKRGVTNPPFDKAPDDGPLRNLLPHEKTCILRSGRGGTRGDHDTVTSGDPSNSTPKNKKKLSFGADTPVDQTPPGAEQALRDLLRRAEVAGAPKEFRDGDAFGNEMGFGNDGTKNDETNKSYHPTSDDLSREMRAFISGDGIDDGTDFKNMASAPIEDVRAELGASREMTKELRWRLRRTENRLEKVTAELIEIRLAALAMRDLKQLEVKEMRDSHRRELDNLINDFERRQAERAGGQIRNLQKSGTDVGYFSAALGTPGFGSRVSTGRSPQKPAYQRQIHRPDDRSNSNKQPQFESRDAKAKEANFFEYLETFQKKTAAMRRRIHAGI
jgi:hypothetical protein